MILDMEKIRSKPGFCYCIFSCLNKFWASNNLFVCDVTQSQLIKTYLMFNNIDLDQDFRSFGFQCVPGDPAQCHNSPIHKPVKTSSYSTCHLLHLRKINQIVVEDLLLFISLLRPYDASLLEHFTFSFNKNNKTFVISCTHRNSKVFMTACQNKSSI